MTRIPTFLFFLPLLTLLWACGGNTEGTGDSRKTDLPYPPLPEDRIIELRQRADYIDYVFYHTDFSISQNEPASVASTVAFIGLSPPSYNPACKPMGRIFFQQKGDILLEGDMYFKEDCLYFLFLEEGKPAYLNGMTREAVGFLNNLFAQTGQSPYPQQ